VEGVDAPPVDLTVEAPSRRERKKEATRRALQDVALRLVEDRGLAGVTVDDITEAADVASRTFFNYFSSKEDAVIGRRPDHAEQLVVALQQRPPGEAVLDSLRRVLTDSFAARAAERDLFLRRIRVVKSEPQLLARLAAQFEQLEERLIAAVAERTGSDPASELDPSLLVSVALAACRAALMHWCELKHWCELTPGGAPTHGGNQTGRDADDLVAVIDAAFDRLVTLFARPGLPAPRTPAPRTPAPRTPAPRTSAPGTSLPVTWARCASPKVEPR